MPLKHAELSDREKLFYGGEASFIDASAQHFRGLTTVAATEIGFLIAALALAGTNVDARDFVAHRTIMIATTAVFLLLSIICGILQSRWIGLMYLFGIRATFLPDHDKVKLSQMRLTSQQLGILLEETQKGAKKNNKKFKLYARLHLYTGRISLTSFVLANAIAIWLVLNVTIKNTVF